MPHFRRMNHLRSPRAVLPGLFLLLAAPLAAAPPMVPSGATTRIADGVYVIPDQGVALVPNVGIVVGDEGVLVIDTGMGPANAEIVLSEVRKVTDLPIRYLVTTHFHPEHNYGAQSFPADTVIIFSMAQQRDLERKGKAYREWFSEMFGNEVRQLLEPVEIVPPDVTFERRAMIDLGGLPVELHYFGHPAHTGGDTVIYLPQQKVVFAGGLAPNNLFPILADADSSVSGWLETLEPLAALEAEIVVPDHGELAGPRLLEQVREYFQSLQSRSLELKREGVELEAAQEMLFEEFTKRYPGWGEPNWINNAVERVYAEAERS